MKRKMLSIILATGMLSSMLGGYAAAEDGGAKKAGVIWYDFADTFTANVRQCLNGIGAADGTISIADADSQFDVATQDNNMNNFFTQGVDYLVINNINVAGTNEIVNKCKEEGLVTIFANCTKPSDENFENYDNLWYVSSTDAQSGSFMGQEIVEYFDSHENWDRNGNGKVDFIVCQGNISYSNTVERSSYSLAAIEEAGYELGSCIGGDDVSGVKGGDIVNGVICEYSRAKAQENVEALLSNYGDDIDCIIADNDDEALGAIAALQAHGYLSDESSYIPVVGVDASAAGCEAIKAGTMWYTNLNNPVTLAKAIYKLMYLLSEGEEITTETIDIEGVTVDGHCVSINFTPISADNIDDASYDITETDF